MTGYIYKITNLINNKVYIGKTVFTIEKRWKEHCKDYKSKRCEKRPLYNAMNKYGIENFTIELVEEVDIDKLSNREIYWIETYHAYTNGYNATKGGDGRILYDYNEFVFLYKQGYTLTQISQFYNCDAGHVGDILRKLGYDTSVNQINSLKKSILVCDKNDNVIQSFQSVSDAAEWVVNEGLTAASYKDSARAAIGRVANGKRKTAYGYKWKYN